jgi:hypothetical protein
MTFTRGSVIEGNIPESIHTDITPKPGFFLHGKHKLIMLHDSDLDTIDPRIALVVPITSAKAEVTRAQREGRDVIASYVQIGQADHPFLDYDCYISTSQIMPINRKWLHTEIIGSVEESKLLEMSYYMVLNFGLQQVVQDLVFQEIQNTYGHLINISEAAAGSE